MEPQKKESQAQHWAAIIGAVAALISAITGSIVAIYSIKRPASIPYPSPKAVQNERTPIVQPRVIHSEIPKPSATPTLSPSPVQPTPQPSSTTPQPSFSPIPSVTPKQVEIPVETPPSPSPEASTVSPSPQPTN